MEPGEPRSGGFLTAGAIRRSPFLALMLSILPAVSAFAGARHFTFLYEAPTSAPGSMELENWVTWGRTTNPDRSDQLVFRHEVEIGVSYEISPRFSVGVELLHEFVLPRWSDEEEIRNLFIGPNVSYRRANWFVTVTALAQATDSADEPDLQVRTIFGIGL